MSPVAACGALDSLSRQAIPIDSIVVVDAAFHSLTPAHEALGQASRKPRNQPRSKGQREEEPRQKWDSEDPTQVEEQDVGIGTGG